MNLVPNTSGPASRLGRYLPMLLTTALLIAVQAIVLLINPAAVSRLLFSEWMQLVLGIVCLHTCVQTLSTARDHSRYYWYWLSLTYILWLLGQTLSITLAFYPNANWDYFDNVVFSVSIIPVAMLLFVDPDRDPKQFDPMHLLDFSQVFIHWLCVYILFAPVVTITTPFSAESFGWTRSAVYNSMVAASLLLRALLERPRTMRSFFGGMAAFMLLSGAADTYVSFPGANVQPGGWFDLVWSGLLFIPIFIAIKWNRSDGQTPGPLSSTRSFSYHFFPLLYPVASLLMLARIAQHHPVLASILIGICFAGVGARMLLIQHRLMQVRARLLFEATHDTLTGAWNHGAVTDFIDAEIKRSERTGEPLGLMMVDLDHFKNVNDTYGHQAGDVVLAEAVQRMVSELRSYDLIGRYGGEEFIVITPNCTHTELLNCAERLRRKIGDMPFLTDSGPISVTASFGVVSFLDGPATCGQLLRAADMALYRAKGLNRNCVQGELCSADARSPAVCEADAIAP